MTKNKSMLVKLEKKVNEVFAKIDRRFPDIEVTDFDYSPLEKAIFLVEEIVYRLRFFCKAKYRFSYDFVFSLSDGFLNFEIELSVTEKKFTHRFGYVFKTDGVKLKPSENHSLFLILHGYNLHCDHSKILEALKKIGSRENLNLRIGFDNDNAEPITPFPEDFYSFEIPLKAKVLKYII